MTTIVVNGKKLSNDEVIAVEQAIRAFVKTAKSDVENKDLKKGSAIWNFANHRWKAITTVLEIIEMK
jgi:hypothetical protein